MNSIKYLHVEYDFIDNEKGELMLVMDAPHDEPADDDNAKFIYDGTKEAMLIRNENIIIHLPFIDEEVSAYLKKLEIILVTEMDGDDIDDVYEAQIEVINQPLPIPDEARAKLGS